MKHHNTLLSLSILFASTLFAGCNKPTEPKASQTASPKEEVSAKIAYVDVDSLIKKYQFCIDYTEILKKKTETIQSTLNNKGLALQKQVADFQSKMQSGSYTREQAESVQVSLQKKQIQLQNLQQSLAGEFEKEQTKYNDALRDSLHNFLKAYNATYGYNFVISKAGDNILLADEKFNITEDVIKGLNKRYKPSKEIQSALKK